MKPWLSNTKCNFVYFGLRGSESPLNIGRTPTFTNAHGKKQLKNSTSFIDDYIGLEIVLKTLIVI